MAEQITALLVFAAGAFIGGGLRRGIYHIWRIRIEEPCLLVELINGLLYVLVFNAVGGSMTGGLFCICASLLLTVGILDWKTFEIPAGCNALIGVLGGIRLFLHLPDSWDYLGGMLIVSVPLFLIYIVSEGRQIGGGDIKLMASSGLLLGWKKIILALFIGASCGAVIHIFLMHIKGRGRVLALGPYLAFGIFISMLYGDGISKWYLLVFG